MMATAPMMEVLEVSALAAKFRQLDNVTALAPWDPLSVYIVDINNSPEQYLKTVEVVVASRPPSSIVLLYNMEELDISVKEGFWPNYQMIRDNSGMVAQVHNKIKVEELSDLPQEFPGTWLCVERDDTKKSVVGLTVVKDEVADCEMEKHIAACVEVVRGKMGAEVDIMVYTNKELNTSEDTTVKNMVLTSWQGGSLFTSTPEIESRKLFDGGIVLKTPVSAKHRRKKLYVEYLKIRDQLLLSPHEYGLDLSIQAGGDSDISIIENGVVEILCKPEEVKSFKLVLRNANPDVHEEVSGGVYGIVLEDCGPLKETDVLELSDDHKLCQGGDNKIRLKPGKKYKVAIKTKGGEIGQVKIPLMVGYYHESRSATITNSDGQAVFQLSRMAVELLIKTQTEEIAELKPATEYIPAPGPRVVAWKANETVKGKPLPKLDSRDALEVKLPLAPTHPPRYRRAVINSRLEQVGTHRDEMVEFKKCKDLVKAGLTPQNYADRWEFLLQCERIQEEKDIRHFDLVGKELKLQRNSGLILLEVPGLAESRPSVLKGDRLFVRESGRGMVEYEGVVHNVGDRNVSLGFGDKLVSKLNSPRILNSWDVRFSFSPFTYDTMHRAVKMAASLPHLFFPSASSLQTVTKPRPIECFDERVSSNPEQLAAVQAIVDETSGPAPFLVFGPPGTGKTVTLVEAIKQVWQLNPQTHILVCAPSNTAADLLAVRLSHHVPREEMMRLIAYSRPVENVPDSVRVFSNLRPGGYEFPNLETLSQYRIIITTLVTAGKLVSAQFPRDHFEHVFIDEAGQATEPETVIALGGVLSPGGRLVMAGDPYQLGPIVRSTLANQHGLARSLLERLINSAPYVNPETGSFDGRCIKKLVRNFRSHQALLELPGRLYYAGELVPCAPAPLVSGCLQFPGLTEAARGVTPIIVHGVVGQDMREDISPSFFNPEELFVVVDYVKKLLDFKVDEDDIGIITPYRRQVQKLRWRLEERGMTDITVGTTEEFQGQERKVIIVSTVRSSPEYVTLDHKHRLGFLADSKRFNVAITRSQALLIVVGNPHILYQDKDWRELLDHARSLDCYKGCAFPEEEESLGKMETKLDKLLREENGDMGARVEETGIRARN